MARKRSPLRMLLSPGRIAIPIVIGLAVASWLVARDFNKEAFSMIEWSWYTTLWMFLALIMMAIRDLGYMWRIRILTDNQFSWKQAFDVIMLWEFASAITPSVVGGSAVAVVIVNKEGVKLGKSTAIVMVTALLDELFYITIVPIVLLVIGTTHLFPIALEKQLFGMQLNTEGLFWLGYGFIILLTTIILIAVFIWPQGAKNFLIRLFSTQLLKRWKHGAIETGNDIVITSKELKNKPIGFWIKALVATYFSWTARYWVVNFLILAFTTLSLSFVDHMLIYGRQLVMWVIVLISPTPGGSGIAEIAFSGFLQEFIAPISLAASIALLWRLVSYYPYLFIGAIILPRWIRRVYIKRKLITFKKT